jgi:hypothetical protein
MAAMARLFPRYTRGTRASSRRRSTRGYVFLAFSKKFLPALHAWLGSTLLLIATIRVKPMAKSGGRVRRSVLSVFCLLQDAE